MIVRRRDRLMDICLWPSLFREKLNFILRENIELRIISLDPHTHPREGSSSLNTQNLPQKLDDCVTHIVSCIIISTQSLSEGDKSKTSSENLANH